MILKSKQNHQKAFVLGLSILGATLTTIGVAEPVFAQIGTTGTGIAAPLTTKAAPTSPSASIAAPSIRSSAPSTRAAVPMVAGTLSGNTAAPSITPSGIRTDRPISLDEVLAQTVSTNSTVLLASERLEKAQSQIEQGYALALPQLSASILDTYSSQKGFSTQGGAASNLGALPGGGAIPVITDQGGGTNGTFTGGGGGGNTPSTNTFTPTTGSGSVSPSGTGTTSTPTSSIGGGASNQMSLQSTPKILQDYAATNSVSPANHPAVAKPNETVTTGSGTTITTGGQRNNYSAHLTVTQAIDITGLVPASLDVLNRTRDFYAIDLQRITNEVSLSIKNTFFNLLRAQAAVAVAQQQVTASTENVRIAQAQFNVGTVAEFNVVTAQTTLSNAQQQLISAQDQFNLAQANLNSVLGTSLDTPLTLVDPATSMTQAVDLPGSLQTAYANRPEIKQADNNIVIANQLIKLSGAGLKPSLTLVGGANYSGSTVTGTSRDTYTITADLGIPLYDGGTTRSRVRSAQIDLDTQRVTRAQLIQNVTLEVRQAYLGIIDAQALAASAQQGVTQATEALRLANIRYRSGIGTFLDVTNAQAQLVSAQTSFLNAQYSYQTALAQMARAMGRR